MPKIVWWYYGADGENHLTKGEGIDMPDATDNLIELVIEFDEGEQPTFYDSEGKEIGVEPDFPPSDEDEEGGDEEIEGLNEDPADSGGD